jgi:hypothetical protein
VQKQRTAFPSSSARIERAIDEFDFAMGSSPYLIPEVVVVT